MIHVFSSGMCQHVHTKMFQNGNRNLAIIKREFFKLITRILMLSKMQILYLMGAFEYNDDWKVFTVDT